MGVTFYQAEDRTQAARFVRDLYATPEHDREPSPPPKNARPVLWLEDPFRVPFRGQLWAIPPVDFRDGVRVLEVRAQLDEWGDSDANVAELYERWSRDVLGLIRRLVRPARSGFPPTSALQAGLQAVRHWSRRVRWRLRLMRNPWRSATDEELGEMLGFFWRRRTRSSARRRSDVPAPVPST